MEVAKGVVEGLTTDEIAAALGVSFHTVRNHLRNLSAATGVRRRAALVRHLLAELFDHPHHPKR
jgi:DNA-binding CsgD family transcriptional regulator